MILHLENFSALSFCLIFLRWCIEPIRAVLVIWSKTTVILVAMRAWNVTFDYFCDLKLIDVSKQRQRFCRHILAILSVSRTFPSSSNCWWYSLFRYTFGCHQPSRLIIAAGVVVFGGSWLKQKFGFMKGVDKGWIAIVKGLESWCVER